ncbi:MAG: GNAT family N-acetyltransferase [Hydrogenobaculum sp.]|nr:MAG: GNAT family N-acetyltransferase [Hydrogenobaculum sp.]PMP62299.1 MAG: GNAT family N-acetyltransferase [Hydrogenobaculum sp.]PMP90621.1 MAG: GNAT family N-acetyltransferase [Hydrogenobaculum sp.]
MDIRKAKIKDAPFIHELINEYAKEGILLPRSLSSIYENIRDFFVATDNEKVIGVCALHIVWEDLAEIKSLAVEKNYVKRGIGKALVERCLEDASYYDIKTVFVLTYQVDFFKKMGFKLIQKETLPHKIWGECINCSKFPSCDEIAMSKLLKA